MAAVSLQPITPAAPGAADQTPARPAAPAAGGNAQADAAPNDTVNLSGAAVPAAQPSQNPGQAGAEFVARGPAIFEALNGGAAPTAPAPANQAAATPNTPVAPNANAATAQTPAPTAAQTGGALLSADTQQEQQQQLAQLDQLLSTLGIDPQSIPLFNQLALLLYLNDPAGLEHFVQQLESVTPVASNPATGERAPQTDQAAGTATNTGVQAAPTNETGANAQAQANGLTLQFQELQRSLATEEQGAQQHPSEGAASSPGQTLNINA